MGQERATLFRRNMGHEQRGTGETWDRRNEGQDRETLDRRKMGQEQLGTAEKHGTGETRDRRNVEQEKRSTGGTQDRSNVGQNKHVTGETWGRRNMEQEKRGPEKQRTGQDWLHYFSIENIGQITQQILSQIRLDLNVNYRMSQ